jgi:hypothetical protein
LRQHVGNAVSERARLRVNLAQSEFEVEGSEAFVRTYAERFDALLDRLNGRPAGGRPSEDPPVRAARAAAHLPSARAKALDFDSLGEYLHHLPRSATDVDRVLVAGYVAQSRSTDNSFSTGEANALLTEQGVKIGNPSQSVKQNVVAKRVFRHQRRYRVSQIGMDHLTQLLGPAFSG